MSFDTLLTVVLLLGAFAGATLLFRSPTVYFEFLNEAARRVYPILAAYFTKRMSEEKEKDLGQSVRRAEEWDNFRKRPRDK